MLGLVIAGLIIFLTLIFFVFKYSSGKHKSKTSDNNIIEEKEPIESEEIEMEKEEEDESNIQKIDLSKYLFKTIKEGNNMKKCYFYNNGHFILFCDEKKLCLCCIKQLNSPSHKIYSKNIDKDVIADVCFSPDKKTVFCASKNSKSIILYNLEKIDGKIKLNKSDKIIVCDRPYEIKAIVTNKSGNLISTIGTNDDTEVQIYNSISLDLQFKQSTGAIENLQILMGPNDSDLLISTFMNDISVISFEKSDKFNNETKKYENIYKFKRNTSISGVKAKILYYCLSNDEKFFAISGNDNTVKIFRNYGYISESKYFTQLSLDYNANVVALYVDNFENGRLSGFIGVAEGSNAFVYDVNGKLLLELPEAHNADIISLYLTKVDFTKKEGESNEEEDDKNGEVCLISAGKDGKIKFWKINN